MEKHQLSILGETPNGKVIEAHPLPGFNLINIKFKSGGQLPKQLQGDWSDIATAYRAVQDYLKVLNEAEAKKHAKQTHSKTV